MGVPAETKILFPLSSTSSSSDDEGLDRCVAVEESVHGTGGGTGGTNKRPLLSKQLSMKETTREAKWEKRRQQILSQRRRKAVSQCGFDDDDDESRYGDAERRNVRGRVTDEDLDELRGSIELGFGFNEEDGGHNLCDTLPALDLYFAVNRQLSDPKLWPSPSPAETPTPASSASNACSGGTPSPRSTDEQEHDSWKICNPGDKPQDVKLRLRQWAQVVACSVRQSRQCC